MSSESKKNINQLLNIKRNVQTITPSDDAFHGSLKHIAAEWWYFDAIFSNKYSIHLGLKTFSKKTIGLLAPLIEIYKNGDLICEEKSKIFFRDLDISKKYPSIRYNGHEIMSFDLNKYQQSNQWQYKIHKFIDTCGIDLTFLGTTPGWKIETNSESWTVPLPKAKVEGTILVDGKEFTVDGMGYHDHNWNYTIQTVMNYGQGWYWGKIASKTFNIVWAKIVRSNKFEILAVINTDDQRFYNINPKNIHLEIGNSKRVGLYKTPSDFVLDIHDVINDIPIDVHIEMNSQSIHYNSVIVAPYFRYHVKSKGYISINTKKEQVNCSSIMEYLRFI